MLKLFYCSNYYYICNMNKLLKEIGATPVTTSIIESLYPELKSPNKKVHGNRHRPDGHGRQKRLPEHRACAGRWAGQPPEWARP